jgi:hypothetical protein
MTITGKPGIAYEAAAAFGALVEIMARLRAPDGCPWDREQTPGTLRPYVLEEAYEVVDAIDRDDPHALCDELGEKPRTVYLPIRVAVTGSRISPGLPDLPPICWVKAPTPKKMTVQPACKLMSDLILPGWV